MGHGCARTEANLNSVSFHCILHSPFSDSYHFDIYSHLHFISHTFVIRLTFWPFPVRRRREGRRRKASCHAIRTAGHSPHFAGSACHGSICAPCLAAPAPHLGYRRALKDLSQHNGHLALATPSLAGCSCFPGRLPSAFLYWQRFNSKCLPGTLLQRTVSTGTGELCERPST